MDDPASLPGKPQPECNVIVTTLLMRLDITALLRLNPLPA